MDINNTWRAKKRKSREQSEIPPPQNTTISPKHLTPSKSEDDNGFEASFNKIQPSADDGNGNRSDFLLQFVDLTSDSDDDLETSCTYDSIPNEFFTKNCNSDAIIVRSKTSLVADVPASESTPKDFKRSHANLDRMAQSSALKDSNIPTEDVSPIKINTKKDTKAQFCDTEYGTVVVINENEKIHFYGIMKVAVICGEVEVLGYILDKNKSEVNLYSTRGSSFLYIRNVTKNSLDVGDFLRGLNLPQLKYRPNCAILLCKKLENSCMPFIEKHMSQQLIPKDYNTVIPRVIFQPSEFGCLTEVSPDWENVISCVTENTRLFICGGKGVGKSTFMRYAINKLLMRYPKVSVIDLDPGQSEFFVPGCVSWLEIDEPIFGCNYTHLKKPVKSILSNINTANEPVKYLESVEILVRDFVQESPTVINFMGFTDGIGLNMVSSAIILTKPTDVLQINSQNPKKNFKIPLTPQAVLEHSRLLTHHYYKRSPNFIFYQIFSMTDKAMGWIARPRELREMCILSYLAKTTNGSSIFKTVLPLHKVSLNKIRITDLNGQMIHPSAVNANFVALCSQYGSLSIFECYGWGIVRGIYLMEDPVENHLVLVTSVDFDVMRKVTHLVLTSITLPPSIFMTADKATGPIPYVNRGNMISFGQMPKRSHIATKK